MTGLAFTPDVYACGIDYVGVSNLFTLLETIPSYWKPQKEILYELIGNPVKDGTLLAKVSPVNHADNFAAPLFIAQRSNDRSIKKQGYFC